MSHGATPGPLREACSRQTSPCTSASPRSRGARTHPHIPACSVRPTVFHLLALSGRVNLGLPWWIGAGEPASGIELAAEVGYDFVEISLDAPWPEELDLLALADLGDDLGVGIGMHGPWRTQALAHPREPLARASREIAQDCLTAARTAGADYIVFHVDARGFLSFPREDVVERGVQTAHASLRALSRSAGEDLEILVENTSPPLGTPEQVARFLDPIPGVNFCLDPGHAAILAHASEDAHAWDPDDWQQAVGDRWRLTHLMDFLETDGRIRDHLLPGVGEADLGAILGAASNAGCSRVLLEAFYADAKGTPVHEEDWRRAREHVMTL